MKNLVILGSSGSIGINTLNVVRRFPKEFKVIALTAFNNLTLLEKQIEEFSPQYVAVGRLGIDDLKRRLNGRKTKVLDVDLDVSRIVGLPEVDIVVIGMRGSAALIPFLSAVRAGKTVAPANKEALVIAGDLLLQEAKKYHARIIPIDSEQSAIFQCLEGRNRSDLKRIYLTASGGPLHNVARPRFGRLTVQQILRHPRWKMGKKITVDSASLMNKGFEVIEAQRLFGLEVDDIEVVIHPEAVVHSMVEFTDGCVLAQLGIADMRLPIQYALTYPARLESGLKPLDFFRMGPLNFSRPDVKKFPALNLCFHVARKGGSLPCVLNAADEEAVDAFLNGRLGFSKIYKVVEKVVLKHRIIKMPGLDELFEADRWARAEAQSAIKT